MIETILAAVTTVALALVLLGAFALWRTKFPPAGTFAEGQRALSLWLMAAAGVFQAVIAVGIVSVLVWGHWGPTQQEKIVSILGWSLIGANILQGLVIGGLLVGGPVGRFSIDASKEGLKAEMGGKDDAPSPETIGAAAAGAAAGAVVGASQGGS
jgi:hypothetical protein